MTKPLTQAKTFVKRLACGYRAPLFVLVLFAIGVPAVAAQAYSDASASQKYTWTGTIKLTNNSVKMCAADSTWACDQGDTLEQHVNLTFTLLGYARTLFIDKSYDLYWVRVAGTSTTIYKTAPTPTPDCPSGQLVHRSTWSGPAITITPAFAKKTGFYPPIVFPTLGRRYRPGRVTLRRGPADVDSLGGVGTSEDCDGISRPMGFQGFLWDVASFDAGKKLKGSVSFANGDVYSWDLKWSRTKPSGVFPPWTGK